MSIAYPSSWICSLLTCSSSSLSSSLPGALAFACNCSISLISMAFSASAYLTLSRSRAALCFAATCCMRMSLCALSAANSACRSFSCLIVLARCTSSDSDSSSEWPSFSCRVVWSAATASVSSKSPGIPPPAASVGRELVSVLQLTETQPLFFFLWQVAWFIRTQPRWAPMLNSATG